MKLLFSILCPKPELRASMEEIQANDWINQPVDINNYKWEDVIRDTEFNGNNAGESNREELLQRINEQNLLKHQEEEDEKLELSYDKIDLDIPDIDSKIKTLKNNLIKTNERKYVSLSKSF